MAAGDRVWAPQPRRVRHGQIQASDRSQAPREDFAWSARRGRDRHQRAQPDDPDRQNRLRSRLIIRTPRANYKRRSLPAPTPRIGVTLGHAGVNAVLVVPAVPRDRGHGSRDLVEQGADLGAVVDLLGGERGKGLKAAVSKILSSTWQRCSVHFMRNALAYAGKTQRPIVSAWVGTAFAQDDAEAARKQWREVADQARPRVPKLSKLMDDAEADVLAYMGFPAPHRAKLHSTNPLERLNGEIKRRSDVVGIFPNEAAVTRLIGAARTERRVGRAARPLPDPGNHRTDDR